MGGRLRIRGMERGHLKAVKRKKSSESRLSQRFGQQHPLSFQGMASYFYNEEGGSSETNQCTFVPLTKRRLK